MTMNVSKSFYLDEVAEESENLQRAFEKRRQQFIRNSEKRKEKAKQRATEKSKEQQVQIIKFLIHLLKSVCACKTKILFSWLFRNMLI